jgi:hypothetical protein
MIHVVRAKQVFRFKIRSPGTFPPEERLLVQKIQCPYLTPWYRVLPEKPILVQPNKKFSAF